MIDHKKQKPGPKPSGNALTNAQRQRNHRARVQAHLEAYRLLCEQTGPIPPYPLWQVRYLPGQKVEERWWQDSTAERAAWCAEANAERLAKGLPDVWEIRKLYAAPIAQTEQQCNHRFMYFGDQTKRRCADCYVVEGNEQPAEAEGVEVVAEAYSHHSRDSMQVTVMNIRQIGRILDGDKLVRQSDAERAVQLEMERHRKTWTQLEQAQRENAALKKLLDRANSPSSACTVSRQSRD